MSGINYVRTSVEFVALFEKKTKTKCNTHSENSSSLVGGGGGGRDPQSIFRPLQLFLNCRILKRQSRN